MNILTTAIMLTTHTHDEHDHEESSGNVLLDAWNIFTDPAHFIAEIGFSLAIDFFILFLGYQLLVKRVLVPRLRKQIHKDLDRELHVVHNDDGTHSHEECHSAEKHKQTNDLP